MSASPASSLRHNEMDVFKEREGMEKFPREETLGDESEIWMAKPAHLIIPLYIFRSWSLSSGPIWYRACILILVPQVQARDGGGLLGGVLVLCSFLCSFLCESWDLEIGLCHSGVHPGSPRCPASLRVFTKTPDISLLGIARELSSKRSAFNHLE